MNPCQLTLQEVLAISDVVVSAVPTASYKVKTEWLKEGCICVNVAADKNFEKDVRDKVRLSLHILSSFSAAQESRISSTVFGRWE